MAPLRRSIRSVVAGLLVALVVSACAAPRVIVAMRDDRVRLGQSSAEIVREAGDPALWVAQDGVETMYFKAGKKTVYFSLVEDKVIAFDDRAAWPDDAERASKDAKKPVSRGAIRVGMTEADVRRILGKPDGVTAVNGIETMHWVAGDDTDSIVELREGKVIGYVDLPTTELTQNVPRHDRATSTTSGAVRLGMTRSEVQGRIGKPDTTSGRDGREVHRYDTNPVFGNHVVYSVEYAGDAVTGFWQENISLAKKEREQREAKAKKEVEREKEKEQEAASASAKSSAAKTVFTFLSNTAVQEAMARRETSVPSSSSNAKARTTGPAAAPSQCACPERTCAIAGSSAVARVQSCRASCIGSQASCQCIGACNDHGFLRDHVCRCN